MQKSSTARISPFAISLFVVLAVVLLLDVANATTFKKLPINGGIFGKRGNIITDYDNTGRALSTLCEIASEACSAWFPQSEGNK